MYRPLEHRLSIGKDRPIIIHMKASTIRASRRCRPGSLCTCPSRSARCRRFLQMWRLSGRPPRRRALHNDCKVSAKKPCSFGMYHFLLQDAGRRIPFGVLCSTLHATTHALQPTHFRKSITIPYLLMPTPRRGRFPLAHTCPTCPLSVSILSRLGGGRRLPYAAPLPYEMGNFLAQWPERPGDTYAFRMDEFSHLQSTCSLSVPRFDADAFTVLQPFLSGDCRIEHNFVGVRVCSRNLVDVDIFSAYRESVKRQFMVGRDQVIRFVLPMRLARNENRGGAVRGEVPRDAELVHDDFRFASPAFKSRNKWVFWSRRTYAGTSPPRSLAS